MWPRNQAEKLKYGNAKHCLLSLDDDHQAHMHLRFQLWKVWSYSRGALKLFSRWIWNSQQNNLFHHFVLIDSFLTDCSHVRHVWLAHTSHLRMEVPASDEGTHNLFVEFTLLSTLLRFSHFSLFPCWVDSVLIAPVFHSSGLTEASISAWQHVSLFSHCGATANTLGTFEQEPSLKGQLQELLVGLNKYLLQGRYSDRPLQKTPGGWARGLLGAEWEQDVLPSEITKTGRFFIAIYANMLQVYLLFLFVHFFAHNWTREPQKICRNICVSIVLIWFYAPDTDIWYQINNVLAILIRYS